MPVVQGLGGAFLYADDVATLADWYTRYLGISFSNWGKVRGVELPSADLVPKGRQASTTFALFQAETPLPKGVRTGRVNFRVEAMEPLLESLRKDGYEVEVSPDESLGRFAWVMDPEGNKVELWEPPLEEVSAE